MRVPTAGVLGRRCGGRSRWCWRSTTTTRALEDHAELLLLGYSPWGKRITHLMTRIAEAATALHDMGSTAQSPSQLPPSGSRASASCSSSMARSTPTMVSTPSEDAALLYLLFHYIITNLSFTGVRRTWPCRHGGERAPASSCCCCCCHQGQAEEDPAVAESTPPELTAKRLHVPLSGRRGSYSAFAS